MTQAALNFDARDPELKRVSSRTEKAIIQFLRLRQGSTGVRSAMFRAEDLHRFVSRQTGKNAPASADRVLRHLRQQGVVDYVVVNRAQSLYRVTGVNHD